MKEEGTREGKGIVYGTEHKCTGRSIGKSEDKKGLTH
jgi:hypothetical protein